MLTFCFCQKKGNVCLGILNGPEVGLGEVNLIGGMNLVTLLLYHSG